MKIFIIEPLRGIRHGVQFGMTREEVRLAMAPEVAHPFNRGDTLVDGFYGSTLQLSYDADGRVEFIEFAREGSVLLDDLDLFCTEAAKVIERLKHVHELEAEEPEPGYSYCFPSIEVGFWRPILPESETDEEGRYFESVGFGREGYYSKAAG